MTNKTDEEWAQIAEDTLAEIDATPDEEIRARMVATPELRAVADAADAVAAAEARLREAVQIARGRGWSWNRIAVPLGTSRQAARIRFSHSGTPAPPRARVALAETAVRTSSATPAGKAAGVKKAARKTKAAVLADE